MTSERTLPESPSTSEAAMLPADPRSATVPAHDCYWALLDPKPLGRARIRDAELGYLFESWIPVALEDVHAVFHRLRDGRIVACGIERMRLAECAGDGLLSLVPEEVPDFITAAAGEPVDRARLEFLTGDYAPPELRRLGSMRRAAVVALVLLAVALAIAGAGRRVDAFERAAVAVDERRAEILDAAYRSDGGSRLPPDLRLVTELRKLRQTRASDAPVLTDASPLLGEVIALWPADAEARCDGISVRDGVAVVRGMAKDAAVVARIEDSFRAAEGWTIDGGVQFTVTERGAAFTLTLRRAAPAAKGDA